MSERREPSARTLDDLCRSRGTMATFRAGLSGQTHQWTVRPPSGEVLAHTVRVHRGGRIRRGLWTLWNMAKLPFSAVFLPLYADHVARLNDLANDFGPLPHVAADQKKSRVNSVLREHLQQAQRVRVVRAVVIGERELARAARQSGERASIPLAGRRHRLVAGDCDGGCGCGSESQA